MLEQKNEQTHHTDVLQFCPLLAPTANRFPLNRNSVPKVMVLRKTTAGRTDVRMTVKKTSWTTTENNGSFASLDPNCAEQRVLLNKQQNVYNDGNADRNTTNNWTRPTHTYKYSTTSTRLNIVMSITLHLFRIPRLNVLQLSQKRKTWVKPV